MPTNQLILRSVTYLLVPNSLTHKLLHWLEVGNCWVVIENYGERSDCGIILEVFDQNPGSKCESLSDVFFLLLTHPHFSSSNFFGAVAASKHISSVPTRASTHRGAIKGISKINGQAKGWCYVVLPCGLGMKNRWWFWEGTNELPSWN